MKILQRLLEDADTEKLKAWQEAVKKAYPDHASKIKFSGKTEKDPKTGKMKNLVSAEVPGVDRCFGVFDTDEMTGEVLGDD